MRYGNTFLAVGFITSAATATPYNWEGGVWHPYVTAGLGMYHYRSTISGALNGADTDAGIDTRDDIQ
jgi:hypothetical protein